MNDDGVASGGGCCGGNSNGWLAWGGGACGGGCAVLGAGAFPFGFDSVGLDGGVSSILEQIVAFFFVFLIALTTCSGSAHPTIVSFCRFKSTWRSYIPAKGEDHQINWWCKCVIWKGNRVCIYINTYHECHLVPSWSSARNPCSPPWLVSV